jgi:hypothetical protein
MGLYSLLRLVASLLAEFRVELRGRAFLLDRANIHQQDGVVVDHRWLLLGAHCELRRLRWSIRRTARAVHALATNAEI